MRALSLWQPHASLMAIGAKVNETRGKPMRHRGELAIHAAATWSMGLRQICVSPIFAFPRVLSAAGYDVEARGWGLPIGNPRSCLPLGCIVAVVTVVDCIEITEANTPKGDEFVFGNYLPGRFMIKTENPRRLAKPIPFKGHQGLFTVPDELIRTSPTTKGLIHE